MLLQALQGSAASFLPLWQRWHAGQALMRACSERPQP